MFIGHLPAGYLCSKAILSVRKNGSVRGNPSFFVGVGLVASVLPDIDMLYFYLIDGRQHLHHSYWTHLPIFWLTICAAFFLVSAVFRKRTWLLTATVFTINIFTHLFLDTLVGDIRWLAPWSAKSFAFFHVPAVHKWWVWNFVFHWTFAFEVVLVSAALCLLISEQSKRPCRVCHPPASA